MEQLAAFLIGLCIGLIILNFWTRKDIEELAKKLQDSKKHLEELEKKLQDCKKYLTELKEKIK